MSKSELSGVQSCILRFFHPEYAGKSSIVGQLRKSSGKVIDGSFPWLETYQLLRIKNRHFEFFIKKDISRLTFFDRCKKSMGILLKIDCDRTEVILIITFQIIDKKRN